MRFLRKRSKRNNRERLVKQDDDNRTADELNQSSPWKIVMLLLFLAVLAVLLLKNDDDDSVKEKKPQVIPNPEIPLPPSHSVLHTFKNAAVSSDSQVCSDIARDVLKNGGNVFDSSISALLCNSLSQIQSMGLLGGFLLTVYIKAEHRSFVVDAQMTSPKNFKNLTDVNGPSAIAIPGFLKGLWEIHQKYGSISWRNLVEPTLDSCKKGITISKHLRDSMHINKRIVNDPYLRHLFVDNEKQKFKRTGSRIIINKQCKFLDIIANQTEPDIYSGVVGEMIAKDLLDIGSVITIEDLKDYKVRWSEAVKSAVSDEETILIPNTASLLIPSILNVLKKFQFNTSSFDSETNINETILTHHRIIEAFKHVFAVRSQLGDPDFIDVDNIVKHILSDDFAQNVDEKIDDKRTFNNYEHYSLRFVSPNDHGTSHISIISENGDALSVTSSINYYFGVGLAGHRTGLIFNNGMDDFSHRHRNVNYFGLEETPTNYPEPGKRALSSMSPIILVDKSGNVKLVIGAAGGSKIISALSLAIIRFSCCTKNIKEIVDAPRFHNQLVPNEIEYEYGVINQVIEGLQYLGHKVRRFNNRGTIVNALSCSTNEINGIADYRKDWSGVSGY